MSNVAACVRRAGGASLSPEQFDRAMTLYQTVLQVTTTNPNPLTNPNRPNLSCVRALPTLALTQQPNTNKTLPTALQRRTQHLGRGHPHTLSTLFCLGSMLVKAGRHADAEPLLSECLAGRRVLSMPARSVQRGGRANSANDRNDIHDSDTREALTALAGCLAHLRRFEAARPLLEEALEGQRRAVARREGRIDADPMAQRQGLEPVAQRQGREPVEHEQGLGPGPVAQEQVPVALGQGPVPPEAQVQGLEPVPQEQGLGPGPTAAEVPVEATIGSVDSTGEVAITAADESGDNKEVIDPQVQQATAPQPRETAVNDDNKDPLIQQSTEKTDNDDNEDMVQQQATSSQPMAKTDNDDENKSPVQQPLEEADNDDMDLVQQPTVPQPTEKPVNDDDNNAPVQQSTVPQQSAEEGDNDDDNDALARQPAVKAVNDDNEDPVQLSTAPQSKETANNDDNKDLLQQPTAPQPTEKTDNDDDKNPQEQKPMAPQPVENDVRATDNDKAAPQLPSSPSSSSSSSSSSSAMPPDKDSSMLRENLLQTMHNLAAVNSHLGRIEVTSPLPTIHSLMHLRTCALTYPLILLLMYPHTCLPSASHRWRRYSTRSAWPVGSFISASTTRRL